MTEERLDSIDTGVGNVPSEVEALPRRTFPNLALFAMFFLLLVAKVAFARSVALGDGSFSSAFVLEGIFVAAVLSPVEVFVRRRFVGYLVIDIVVTAVLAVTVVYSNFFDRVLALDALRFAGQMGDVEGSILKLLRPQYLLFLADIPLLAAAGVWFYRREKWWKPGRSNSHMTTAFAVVWVVLVALVWTMAARSQIGASKSLAREYGLMRYQVAVLFERGGVPAIDTVDTTDPVAVQMAADIYKNVPPGGTPASDFRGVAAGRNLIVIQVESMGNAVIDASIDGTPITPNLDNLARDGFYFPRTYFQVGLGGTSDAEFMFNSSLYSRPDLASGEMVAQKAVPALPRLLGGQGYATTAFHANEESFWNRDVLFPALGFETFHDITFFGEHDNVGIGPSDEVLFEGATPVLQQFSAKDTPFYAYFITLTPHHPFDLPPEKIRLTLPPKYDDTLVGDYFRVMNYEDWCIGNFLDKMEAAGILENSVVVVMGDHFGLDPETIEPGDAQLLEEVLGRPYTMVDKLNVPLIMYAPGVEGARIDRTVGQVDIFPTIAELMGIDTKGVAMFGKSAFAKEPANLLGERYYLPPGSYIDEKVMFVPGTGFDDGTVYDLASGEETASTAATRDEFDNVVRLMELSDAYVNELPQSSD